MNGEFLIVLTFQVSAPGIILAAGINYPPTCIINRQRFIVDDRIERKTHTEVCYCSREIICTTSLTAEFTPGG